MRRSSTSILDGSIGTSHPTGTIAFVGIDGEGINDPISDSIDSASCENCEGDLANKTRYRKAGKGPFCRKCYYTKADMK